MPGFAYMLDACLRLTMSRREVVASKAMGHRVKHIQVVMKKRPWQDANLQYLAVMTPVKAQEPMPYPFGHRVNCMRVDIKSDPGRIRTCIFWFHRRDHPGAVTTNVRQDGDRIQCLIHSATGSNADARRYARISKEVCANLEMRAERFELPTF